MTLRARVLWTWAAVLVLLVAAGLVLVASQRSVLLGQVDDHLTEAEKVAVRVARADEATAGVSAGVRIPPALAGMYVGTLDAHGVLTTLTTPADDTGLVPVLDAALPIGVPTTVPTADGSPGGMRVVAYPAPAATHVVVGTPLDAVRAATAQMTRTLLIVLLVCLAVLGAALFWVLRLGIGPITRVTQVARALRSGDDSRRVEAFPPGTEAQELGEAFNLLVDANAASEQRLRRFVADASHELRTPLATLTGYTSLYAAGGLADPGALDDAMSRIRNEAGRMQVLVDELLLLADLDRGPVLGRDRVDLAQVLDGLVADLRVVAPDRVVTLVAPDPVVVEGDEVRLTQALAALTSNAVRHTPERTAIHVSVRGVGGQARVDVGDEGPGIAAEDLPRLFDRFYRADEARARGNGGNGLGLSIAAAIISAHGGRIGVRARQPRGSTFWIDLPEVVRPDAG